MKWIQRLLDGRNIEKKFLNTNIIKKIPFSDWMKYGCFMWNRQKCYKGAKICTCIIFTPFWELTPDVVVSERRVRGGQKYLQDTGFSILKTNRKMEIVPYFAVQGPNSFEPPCMREMTLYLAAKRQKNSFWPPLQCLRNCDSSVI